MVRKRSPVQSRSQARKEIQKLCEALPCEKSSPSNVPTANAGITRRRRTRRSSQVALSTRSFAAAAANTRSTKRRGSPAREHPRRDLPGRSHHCGIPCTVIQAVHHAAGCGDPPALDGPVSIGRTTVYVSSSIGRAAVSKTAGWGFESLLTCGRKSIASCQLTRDNRHLVQAKAGI